MTAWFRRVAVLVGATILLVGCSSLAGTKDTLDLKRFSENWAVAMARDWVGPHAEFIRAETGTLGDFDKDGEISLPEESRNHTVWAVYFRGMVSFSCPITPSGPPPECPDVDTEMLVVLDYGTGEFLFEVDRPWPQPTALKAQPSER
jgi:hypothetical protein